MLSRSIFRMNVSNRKKIMRKVCDADITWLVNMQMATITAHMKWLKKKFVPSNPIDDSLHTSRVNLNLTNFDLICNVEDLATPSHLCAADLQSVLVHAVSIAMHISRLIYGSCNKPTHPTLGSSRINGDSTSPHLLYQMSATVFQNGFSYLDAFLCLVRGIILIHDHCNRFTEYAGQNFSIHENSSMMNIMQSLRLFYDTEICVFAKLAAKSVQARMKSTRESQQSSTSNFQMPPFVNFASSCVTYALVY